jgi:hypothetical protein
MQSAHGSTTVKRKKKKKGLEPNECYWIKNEAQMRAKKTFDPERDPPPDLAVEIDISESSLDRMGIYAALGIPEIWRFDGESFQVYLLGATGKYEPSAESLSFPFLPLARVELFLRESNTRGETSLVRAIAAWVRSDLMPAYQAYQAKSRKRSRATAGRPTPNPAARERCARTAARSG